MSDKCPDCPAPSADMDGFIVSGPGGAPRSESAGVSSSEGPFAKEAPQTGHFILKGKVSSSSPLPDVPEPGWAYEAAEAGTYGGVHATPGDLIWCAGVNPVRWRIAQSDFDGAVRSVSVQQVLSSGTKIATVTVDGQATDLYCEPSGLASVSASFECREEPVQLPLAFYVHLCEYWDDGETDGCYSQDAGNDPVNFSFISGVETKIATLQAIPEVSDTYYTLYIEIGDVSYNGRSGRSGEREASDDTLYYCGVNLNVGSQYIQVNESQDITFTRLYRSYRNSGETWRRMEITSISSTSVSINSDLFGQYTVSARAVREPNGPSGEYVISVYATAVSAEAGSGTTPILSLTSTGADGTSSTQEVDMSCLGGGSGIQTLSGDFGCETSEVSPAVDEPAVLYATQMVFLDQTGYETLESGSIPYGHYSSAYSGSHQSASFSTSVPSSAPYAVALSTGTSEYASDYKLKTLNLLDWSYGGAVKVSDLLAAGEDGVKLDFSGGDAEPYGDGTLDVYASFSASQDGSYTVSYSARKDAVTEDILTAKIDGKDGSGEVVSSVDVSPLLNYIGGRVENVPAGDSEMLPLVDQDNPGVEPPFYFANFDFYNDSYQQAVFPDEDFSDGALIASFSSLEPESFVPLFFYGDPASQPSLAYSKVDSFTGNPARFSLETALAGPLALDELDLSSNPPVPTGNTVSLVTERVEGAVPAYRFTLYSGSGEMKKVLRLYPSCDGDIDLSGLVPSPSPSPSGGVEDYELAFEKTASSGDPSLLADLSSYKAGADGFLDVVAVIVFFSSSLNVVASVSTSGSVQPLTAAIQHPNPSSESMGLGFVRFWKDGGMTRVSSGSGYNANGAFVQASESYCFNIAGALRDDIPYFAVLAVTGDTRDTTLKVYVRRAHEREL